MSEKWTTADLSRAIFNRTHPETSPPAPVSADDALMTMVKLLTGAGGPIDDAEVRRLESWLDKGGR